MHNKFRANPVSEGISIGETFHYCPYVPNVVEKQISEDDIQDALLQYENAQNKAKEELQLLQSHLKDDNSNKARIFDAHIDILFDAAMDEDIRDEIDDLNNPAFAVNKVYEKYIRIIGKLKDELIAERVADIRDVKNRLLRCLEGVEERNLAELQKPVVIVAYDLLPSVTATLDKNKVLAIITEVGGSTSHSAIIARSYGIPALLGLKDAMNIITDKTEVIVDAVDGEIILYPTAEQKEKYSKKREKFLIKQKETKQYISQEAKSTDGTKIDVEINLGSASSNELQGGCQYTDGVGLFRTEFIYMGRPDLPTEDEQFEIYKKVLLVFKDSPVTIRTLDIGGDKKLDSMKMPIEENPFLGNRALRLCLSNPQIFKTQLRACLRASVYGNLWLMFPMVGSLDDVRAAKKVLQEAKDELDKENIPYSKDIKFGVMIEIPSIALLADMVAKEVDFVSIGTNDLTQYTMAADRMNPTVNKYYQSNNPAIYRLINYVTKEFKKQGKDVCVCGEMGGNKLSAPVLVGMGIRRLSMGLASVASVKKVINNLSIQQMEELANQVCQIETDKEIVDYLSEKLSDLI